MKAICTVTLLVAATLSDNIWIAGEPGSTCDDTCAAEGRFCDANMQSTITSSDLIESVFADVGQTCTSAQDDHHRSYPGAPFHTGASPGGTEPGACYYLTPGAKSVCNANKYAHHVPLCSCRERSTNVYEHMIGEVAFWYAFGAYCSKGTIGTWVNGMGVGQSENNMFQVDRVVNDNVGFEDMQAFTGWDPVNSRIIISFRGSANGGNWYDNFNFASEAYINGGTTGARVHPGFFDGWQDLQNGGMTEAIIDIVTAHAGADILVTGHSLGGALATICAVELGESELYNQLPYGSIDVITFGSPRVGNNVFTDLFRGNVRDSWRIVNRYDIAATLPPHELGYRHVGTQLWYRRERWWWNEKPTEFKTCNGSGEDKSCFGSDLWLDRLPMPHHHLNYFGRGWLQGVCSSGPMGQWVAGEPGSTCDEACAAEGAVCDADMQNTITSPAIIESAFREIGYNCTSAEDDQHRSYAGAPFHTGASVGGTEPGACYFLTPGAQSVCDANLYSHHVPLCYCRKTE